MSGIASTDSSVRRHDKGRPLFFFCLSYIIAAVALVPSTYFALLATYTLKRYSVVMPLLIMLGLVGAAIIRRPRSPLAFVRDKLASRGVGVIMIVTVFVLGAAAFSTFKHVIPMRVPFFADPFLANLDTLVHFGEPWRMTQSILPKAFESTLFFLYSQVWFLQMVGMLLFAAFLENDAARLRYLWSFAVTAILLGTLVRLAGSSSGPIFYDRMFGGDRFAPLIERLQDSAWGKGTLLISDYLYSSYSADSAVFGTGIAAMPSLHVATAVLNAIFITTLSRWVGFVAWLYAICIIFGSVHFGWHYGLDAYVSIIAVALIWRWADRFKDRDVCVNGGGRSHAAK